MEQVKDSIENVSQKKNALIYKFMSKLLHSFTYFKENCFKLWKHGCWILLKVNFWIMRLMKKYSYVTHSKIDLDRYNDLISGLKPHSINQVWIADINFINTLSGFLYLSLITDLYSLKIIGHGISDGYEMIGAKRALKMALKQRKNNVKTIHHSNHGIQYCSLRYIDILESNSIKISISEKGNYYKNPVKDDINKILKEEFKTKQQVVEAVNRAIYSYNTELSLATSFT